MTLARRIFVTALTLTIATACWAGYLWVRDLSLMRIRHVTVSGVDGPQAASIKRALRQTASRMTTLHVRHDELQKAVGSFAAVHSVTASADFPNTLHIRVSEYEPVAALVSPDGRRVAVSGEGILLRGLGPKARLPTVKVTAIPGSRVLPNGPSHTLVEVLGRAPGPLRPLLVRAYASGRDIRVAVRDGPIIDFGSARELAAKWAAAARVLADPGSSGAHFIDVRLPQRPAATEAAPGQGGTSGLNTQL
jgi:cell division protein FtsQ